MPGTHAEATTETRNAHSPERPGWKEFVHAPLVPYALAVLIGLILDRYWAPPLESYFALALLGLCSWVVTRSRDQSWARFPLGLWIAAGSLAAAHHHVQRCVYSADDIGWAASPVPQIVKVRGTLLEEPTIRPQQRTELYGPTLRADRATSVLEVSAWNFSGRWQPVTGKLRLIVDNVVAPGEVGALDDCLVGDELEVIGLLSMPARPANPGESDYAGYLADRRIRAELRVQKDAKGVTRIGVGPISHRTILARIRAACIQHIQENLSARNAVLARALLLGDRSAMDREDWNRFARTGVVHVLAISGQHLLILAGFVWVLLRLANIPTRRGIWVVIILVVSYAILTGLRPSALRAAVMVTTACLALSVRRPVPRANLLALAFLAVVAWDPVDAISVGSQLSFLSVFLLIWLIGPRLMEAPQDPLERLEDHTRSPLGRMLRQGFRVVLKFYAMSAVLTLANMPLIMYSLNIAPPVGVLAGPPVIVLSSLALLTGFVGLMASFVRPELGALFFILTEGALEACTWLVNLADTLPGGSLYVPGPPLAWVLVFYALLIMLTLAGRSWQPRLLAMLGVWTLLGLIGIPDRDRQELRVTWLAVGHGGCTVLECPDGRVILYDAGTMSGPEIVRYIIAPYLWHRGIRRVDELILSHADLDHYNGVPALLERFPIGRVTMTPTFAEKLSPEVAEMLLALDRHRVPRQVAVRGQVFQAGSVTMEVLHPYWDGPGATENERSLVLRVGHAGHVILLTGDLEKAGTSSLLRTPPQAVDVLQAPHHGSLTAFPEALRMWANPKLVVVSRSARESPGIQGADIWNTGQVGAVTLISHRSGLVAEAFVSGDRRVIRRNQ